ncbi:hypothetical protein NDU88_003349 [Pleurodeles waltl]|uniref:Uncharacterized protein n=1 Tax=Pleurodeles waltl TaxID=8319 RepID=A0AAV7SF54_PLEWA|nr:hypothetical protein NDU88_003349 [Pleurodeles waltl]
MVGALFAPLIPEGQSSLHPKKVWISSESFSELLEPVEADHWLESSSESVESVETDHWTESSSESVEADHQPESSSESVEYVEADHRLELPASQQLLVSTLRTSIAITPGNILAAAIWSSTIS